MQQTEVYQKIHQQGLSPAGWNLPGSWVYISWILCKVAAVLHISTCIYTRPDQTMWIKKWDKKIVIAQIKFSLRSNYRYCRFYITIFLSKSKIRLHTIKPNNKDFWQKWACAEQNIYPSHQNCTTIILVKLMSFRRSALDSNDLRLHSDARPSKNNLFCAVRFF